MPLECWRPLPRYVAPRRKRLNSIFIKAPSREPANRFRRTASRLVPRCEVRHLGALGSAIGARAGRLVCPQHVYPGSRAVQFTSKTLRPSDQGRLQGPDRRMEGRQVRSRTPDGSLQKSGREVFRQHGRPPRRLRPVEFETHRWNAVNMGPKKDVVGLLQQGGTQARPAVRRERALWISYKWSAVEPRFRQDRAARGRALRW